MDIREETGLVFRPNFPPLESPLDGGLREEEDDRDKTQINPKLGLLWRPREGTTLRAAAFRTLRRPLSVDGENRDRRIRAFRGELETAQQIPPRLGVGAGERKHRPDDDAAS